MAFQGAKLDSLSARFLLHTPLELVIGLSGNRFSMGITVISLSFCTPRRWRLAALSAHGPMLPSSSFAAMSAKVHFFAYKESFHDAFEVFLFFSRAEASEILQCSTAQS